MKNVVMFSFVIFYCPVVYFMAIEKILWSFGILLPFLVCFTKKIWQPWSGSVELDNFQQPSPVAFFSAGSW
jgi:hypothetical protein